MKRNMLSSATTNTMAVTAAAFLGLVLTSLTGLFMARTLPKEQYGVMTYFANWFPPMLLILGLGLTAKVIRDVAEWHLPPALEATPEGTAPREALGTRLYTLLALRLITLTPLPLLGGLGWALTGQHPYALIALAAMAAVLTDFVLGIMRGSHLVRPSAAMLLLQPVTYAALLAGGLVTTVSGIFLALGLSYMVSLGMGLLVLLWYRRWPRPQRRFFSQHYARHALKPSAKIYLISLCQTGFQAWPLLLLGGLGHYTIVAELSIPLSLVALLPLALVPIITTLVYPRLVEPEAGRAAFQLAYRLIAALTIVVALVFAFFGQTVIELLYSDRYVNTAPLLLLQAPLVVVLALEALMTLTQIGLEQFRPALRVHLGRLGLLVLGSLLIGMGMGMGAAPPTPLEQAFSGLIVTVALGGFAIQRRDLGRALPIPLGLDALLGISLLVGTEVALLRWLLPVGAPLWLRVVQAMAAGVLGLVLALPIAFGPALRPGIRPAMQLLLSRYPFGKEQTP